MGRVYYGKRTPGSIMRIHILGICGKFMSGLAVIARQMGHTVTGADQNLIPSISSMLQDFQIEIHQGYEESVYAKNADLVIIGNALSRGRKVIEFILNQNIAYISGPQWLAQNVLSKRWVLGISGTHGKTTTTSLVTFILEKAGFNPGYMIGGNAQDFACSARYTDSNFFVIEADEYDTAFFDKRSKFLHYSPRTLVINNLEFDHADIFSNLEDIKKQFWQLLRIIPSDGSIICPINDPNVNSLFAKENWTPRQTIGKQNAEWTYQKLSEDGSHFEIWHKEKQVGSIKWEMLGEHNIMNALAAIASAYHMGITPDISIEILKNFKGVKRRLELKGKFNNIHIYDDFAHHPTAIETTLSALRNKVKNDRIFAVLEFGSNTLKSGYHQDTLVAAFHNASEVIFLRPKQQSWNIENLIKQFQKPVKLFNRVDEIVNYLLANSRSGDHILIMTNLTFDGLQQKLIQAFSINQGVVNAVS